MGFVRFNGQGTLLDSNGNPVYIVGVNYVASYVCTNFWEDWRPEAIERDLKRISELGLNAVRIPMFWGFNEPEPGKYNPLIVERFDIFLQWARKYELYVMPWFLIGVATGDYDVPFRNGRPFFSGEMLEVAENHLKFFTGRYKDEERILFWDICDEPEFYEKHHGAESIPYDRKSFARWVRSMYNAIKSVDQNHLVTLGFGAIATMNYGMHIRDMAEILDLMVVTCYPFFLAQEGVDSLRNNYFLTYNVKFNTLGKPVLACEAPGFNTVFYSEEILGRYFKTSIYSNLVNGSKGVMPWVFNDFAEDIWQEYPLNEKTYEPSFGIVDVNGRIKPHGKELIDFARFAREATVAEYVPAAPKAAVLVPKGYYEDRDIDINQKLDDVSITYKKIYSSMLLAKGCSTDVDFLWEDNDFSSYRLLVIPSTKRMTTAAWDKVRKFVRDGGTALYIYENMWNLSTYTNELFGVEVQTPHRDFGYDRIIAGSQWGGFSEGDEAKLVGYGREEFLKVKPVSAQVLCGFIDGNPAVLRNRYGKGSAFMVTSPVLNNIMDTPYEYFLENPLFKIFDSVIDEAGIGRKVTCGNCRIETGLMVHLSKNEAMVVCINHDNSKVETRLSFDAELASGSFYDMFSRSEVQIARDQEGKGHMDICFEAGGVIAYRVCGGSHGLYR